MFVNLRRAGESTTLSAAVRSDDNEDFGRYTSWLPTALTETGLEGVAFKAAYGTGFRAPLLTRSALTNHRLRSPKREITRLKKSRAKVGRWVFAAVKTTLLGS